MGGGFGLSTEGKDDRALGVGGEDLLDFPICHQSIEEYRRVLRERRQVPPLGKTEDDMRYGLIRGRPAPARRVLRPVLAR